MRFTARQYRSTFRHRIFHVLSHFIDGGTFNQRANDHALILTVAHFQRVHRLGKFCHKGVIDGFLNEEAVHADAHLSGIAKFIGNGPFHGGIYIGIFKDDIRCITPELH
ncbi:hypothetical protein D3C85_1501290 [compost metagenome]